MSPGLYFFDETGYVHDFVPFEGLLYVYDLANDVQNKDYAAFIHADYKLTDGLSFTAGGRFTDVQTYFTGGQSDLNSFPFGSYCWQHSCGGVPPYTDIIPNANPPGSAFFRYFPNTPDSQAWHIFDPTLGVQYHFTDDMMTYFTFSKGFKQGGWTTRLSDAIPAAQDARFGPEYSKTYELGLKSEWLDHHLLANAAVYFTNYDDIQLNIQQGISPCTPTRAMRTSRVRSSKSSRTWVAAEPQLRGLVHRRVLHLHQSRGQHPAVLSRGRHAGLPGQYRHDRRRHQSDLPRSATRRHRGQCASLCPGECQTAQDPEVGSSRSIQPMMCTCRMRPSCGSSRQSLTPRACSMMR
jgi:hypothetical protein